jgi:hypothetical protein
LSNPINRNNRSTDAKLAAARGTNRQYVADVRRAPLEPLTPDHPGLLE